MSNPTYSNIVSASSCSILRVYGDGDCGLTSLLAWKLFTRSDCEVFENDPFWPGEQLEEQARWKAEMVDSCLEYIRTNCLIKEGVVRDHYILGEDKPVLQGFFGDRMFSWKNLTYRGRAKQGSVLCEFLRQQGRSDFETVKVPRDLLDAYIKKVQGQRKEYVTPHLLRFAFKDRNVRVFVDNSNQGLSYAEMHDLPMIVAVTDTDSPCVLYSENNGHGHFDLLFERSSPIRDSLLGASSTSSSETRTETNDLNQGESARKGLDLKFSSDLVINTVSFKLITRLIQAKRQPVEGLKEARTDLLEQLQECRDETMEYAIGHWPELMSRYNYPSCGLTLNQVRNHLEKTPAHARASRQGLDVPPFRRIVADMSAIDPLENNDSLFTQFELPTTHFNRWEILCLSLKAYENPDLLDTFEGTNTVDPYRALLPLVVNMFDEPDMLDTNFKIRLLIEKVNAYIFPPKYSPKGDLIPYTDFGEVLLTSIVKAGGRLIRSKVQTCHFDFNYSAMRGRGMKPVSIFIAGREPSFIGRPDNQPTMVTRNRQGEEVRHWRVSPLCIQPRSVMICMGLHCGWVSCDFFTSNFHGYINVRNQPLDWRQPNTVYPLAGNNIFTHVGVEASIDSLPQDPVIVQNEFGDEVVLGELGGAAIREKKRKNVEAGVSMARGRRKAARRQDRVAAGGLDEDSGEE